MTEPGEDRAVITELPVRYCQGRTPMQDCLDRHDCRTEQSEQFMTWYSANPSFHFSTIAKFKEVKTIT